MDPITAAIMAVLPALAGDVVKAGVKDAYDGLKAVIIRKWGDKAPISKAIAAVEEDPKSKAQAAVLQEKVEAVNAKDDADVMKALQALLEQMKAHNVGGDAASKILLNISGGTVQGIVGSDNVQVGTMNFGTPPKG